MENKYNNEKEDLMKDGVKVAESPHIYNNQPVPSKFTDPLTDFGFKKKLFGGEQA
ncbi:MAG TPA: hypothetical protein VL053_03555 [Arachidicoccus sp.]|nr:hypothetical protein [Arachidicoccus sp.]